MENLLSREISHHFVQNFDEMLSRFFSIAKTLQLGFCFTQGRAKRLNLVAMLLAQTVDPPWGLLVGDGRLLTCEDTRIVPHLIPFIIVGNHAGDGCQDVPIIQIDESDPLSDTSRDPNLGH